MRLNIDYKTVDSLIPYVNNAKQHEDAQITKIAASIKEFGFTNPVLLDGDNGVIAGHGRIEAAKKIGMDEVPTIELAHLSDIQKKAYILADNRLAEVDTSWDFDLVSMELEGLQGLDFDIDLTGFDEGFILKQPEEGLTDDDEVPDVPDDPVTVLGDVWLCGEHRVMCGDSTDTESIERLMGGGKASYCFTSPPYNGNISIGVQAGQPKFTKKTDLYRNNKDDKTSDDYIQFNVDIVNNLVIASDDDFTLCYNINYNRNSPSEYIDIMYLLNKAISLVDTITWQKSSSIPVKGNNLTRAYEFIFVLSRGKYSINKSSTDESIRNIWKISNVGAQIEEHRACFPVALVEKGIRTFAPHGSIIIEPFGGSGTTMIAAEKTGCKAMLMELDERYTDISITRWQNFTGKQATLESTGKTYAEMTTERVIEEVA